MKRDSRNLTYSLLVVMSFVLILATGCEETVLKDPLDGKTIQFGALLDLSVNDPENGLCTKTAIEIALDDLNNYTGTVGRDINFTCRFEDTHMDTTEAKNLISEMYEDGIDMFVAGPYSSSELKAIAPFLAQNPVVLINSNSTAVGLNQAGSHFFRIISDDSFQARALVRAVVTNGVKAVIPIVRNDVWGNSLLEDFTTGFEQEEGVIYSGVVYEPSETSFSAAISTIESQVNNALAVYDTSQVVVLALTYHEIEMIFDAARQSESLGSVTWYGCDATAQLKGLITDSDLAEFAIKTEFLSPIMGIINAWSTPAFTADLSARIESQTGNIPNAYALSTYDATFIMGLACLETGDTDIDKILAIIPLICNNYAQMGISRRLNASGDLETADYVFWRVSHNQSGYYWEKIATYLSNSDSFQYKWE
ncbi:MAG: ABC transporter substrate-binding protein [Bacteroidales bacterium]|nr:ABC transporter substrate-binding protein [Bacteroidales bacterium]